MGALIQAVIGFFGQGVGQKLGATVANGVSIAALAPLAMWFLGHKDELAISLTWGELAFIGGLLFAVIKAVHYTAAPRRAATLDDWKGGA